MSGSGRRGSPTRVAVISSHVQDPQADNAGVRYLGWMLEAIADTQAVVVAPDGPMNRRSLSRPHPVRRVLLPGDVTGHGLRRRLVIIRQRLTPERPAASFVAALRHDPRVSNTVRDADVIDLEWPAMAALAGRLRRLAPNARLVATLHDVASQRFRRQHAAAVRPTAKLRAVVSLRYALHVERRVCRWADAVIVFSDKDRLLLPRCGTVVVVDPPVAMGVPDPSDDAPGGIDAGNAPVAVVVGALTRVENLDAARWLVGEIWPRVRTRVPEARLQIVGTVEGKHRAEFAGVPGVDVVGFVADLDTVYRSADVVLAPVRQGAGVKFKVLDALVRGVPVVTTSVGAEGIGDRDFTLPVHDTAASFAEAATNALRGDPGVVVRARLGREWAAARYGHARFRAAIRASFGLDGMGSGPVSGQARDTTTSS